MAAILFWVILGRMFFGTIGAWSHDSDHFHESNW